MVLLVLGIIYSNYLVVQLIHTATHLLVILALQLLPLNRPSLIMVSLVMRSLLLVLARAIYSVTQLLAPPLLIARGHSIPLTMP